MTIKQELCAIRDTIILADIEVDSLLDLLKNSTEDNLKKAIEKMSQLKRELEECI